MRVLIVEDDPATSKSLELMLKAAGMVVDTAGMGEDGLEIGRLYEYDIILLDIMLPDISGYDVLKRLRAARNTTPVLILSGLTGPDKRVKGLGYGADDYLTKPFDFKELLARLRALARRSVALRPAVIRVADLSLDTASHRAERAGRRIGLTAKEYALLEYLMLNEGRVVGREQIAQHVWDESFDPFSNVIDVYIRRLRSKLDAAGATPLIHTRRGEGYVLTARAEGV